MQCATEIVFDDPARTAAPEGWSARDEAAYYADLAERQEWHFCRIKPLVVAALAGYIPFTPALLRGSIQKMEGGDIWESITGDLASKDVAKLLAGYMDRDAHSEAAVYAQEIIDGFCNKTAAHMAKAEIGSEE